MKIGDKVRSKKVRHDETATITYVSIIKMGKKCRTTYNARFDDGSELTFYGFDIGKTVFKVEECDGQMCLDDFMNPPVEDLS